LGFTAGGLLYLCAVNLLPELKADLEKSKSIIYLILDVILIYAGVIIMFYMTALE
jgi:zinc transporter ZupT